MLSKPKTVVIALAVMIGLRFVIAGQQPAPTSDETIKVKSDLVETAVTVSEKDGRFISGLKKGDLSLKVDGKVVPISFFEEVSAGTSREWHLRPGTDNVAAVDRETSSAAARGRTIIFFLDDLHLALDSIHRTRQMLLDFVNTKMNDQDQVAIASAKGTIGFLQQFTDDKVVLRAAIDRIIPVPYVVSDPAGLGAAPMTEYNALSIERRDDPRVFDFYVSDCITRGVLAADPRMKVGVREACQVEVRTRARSILVQAGTVTEATYISFEYLLDTAARMAGSKLAFFISDGFLADSGPRGRISIDRVGAITSKARKAGVIIYSIDARGLVSGALDATGTSPMDPDGRLENANLRSISASQDAMNALAVDTGGRALRNQNFFEPFVASAVTETSSYYLVAWQPESEDAEKEKSKKIQIAVVGRPELTVRAGKGFLRTVSSTPPNTVNASVKKPGDDLKNALTDAVPGGSIRIDLSAVYIDMPGKGIVLTSSVQVPSESLSFGSQGNEQARVTVAGVILDDHGKPAGGFSTGLKVDPHKTRESPGSGVIYNYPTPIKPGIYQIRAVARDDKSGVLGSAARWIVVPDLAGKELSTSSLLLGLQSISAAGQDRSQWSIDRRFAKSGHLRFMAFIYNAARGGDGKIDLAATIKIRQSGAAADGLVKTITIQPETDLERIPMIEELDLRTLAPGRYDLYVTIADRLSQKNASQHAIFFVE